uniref:Uncharacterized protein n=1 Tax=Onchocerca volvulus TaxID=6282 RepID=A0A8R1XX55_ONCVO
MTDDGRGTLTRTDFEVKEERRINNSITTTTTTTNISHGWNPEKEDDVGEAVGKGKIDDKKKLAGWMDG